MAFPFTFVADYVPDGIEITREELPALVELLEPVKDKMNEFGNQHIESATVMPDNTPDSECVGEGKPMLTYTEIDWAHMPEEDKADYLAENEGETPSDDHTSVRVTINDGYFAPFVEETFADQTQETRYKLAMFLRHSLFSYAHGMIMPMMLKHKMGIDLNQLKGVDSNLEVEEIAGAEGTSSEE